MYKIISTSNQLFVIFHRNLNYSYENTMLKLILINFFFFFNAWAELRICAED